MQERMAFLQDSARDERAPSTQARAMPSLLPKGDACANERLVCDTPKANANGNLTERARSESSGGKWAIIMKPQ